MNVQARQARDIEDFGNEHRASGNENDIRRVGGYLLHRIREVDGRVRDVDNVFRKRRSGFTKQVSASPGILFVRSVGLESLVDCSIEQFERMFQEVSPVWSSGLCGCWHRPEDGADGKARSDRADNIQVAGAAGADDQDSQGAGGRYGGIDLLLRGFCIGE